MAETPNLSSAEGISKGRVGSLYVRELGLTQIDGHPKNHHYNADVVFVHGLQGHPRLTWQSKSPAKAHKGIRERFKNFIISGQSSQARGAHGDGTLFWPAEILPRDFDDLRIMTYGYDSKVTRAFKGPTSKNGIFEHGQSFLGALGRVRVDCGDRPIIFIAHSLGGLLVKQALIEARKQVHDPSSHDTYNNSHAIIFFGTPHRGSNMAYWGRLLSGIAQATQMDTHDGILIDLDPKSNSSKLRELNLDFDDILCDNQKARQLRVFSFQEAQGMTGVNLLGGKVVPNESSSLDSRKFGNDTIHANHMGMCRFQDENDDGYEKFKGVLANFIARIKSEQQNATKTSLEGEAIRRAELLRSLDYAERNSREHQLRNIDAKEGSLSWIWSSSTSFTDWLSSSEGLFWIYGKPGSGKSTLMDYLAHNSRVVSNLQKYSPVNWKVLRFFFDFRRGKRVTNSFEGLLRSLLYQLIKGMPQIDVQGLDKSEQDSISGWPEHRLRDALRGSLEGAKDGVCILVDGLDEYEGSFLTLIPFLQSLATSNGSERFPIKICVSSRPEPVLSQYLQQLPQLSMSDHNASGIRSYCSLTIEEIKLVVLEDLYTSRLSQLIAERAEGVFLWARFALEELVQGYSSGETFEEILKRLNSIPDSLEKIFDRMLGRVEPLAKKECMVMLQLVRFARSPLSLQEHHAATKFAMGRDLVIVELTSGDKDSGAIPNMYNTYTKRLRAKSVGLIELVNGTEARLIHRCVSTYLDQKGWQILGESQLYNWAKHQSWYVGICTRYLHRLLLHLNPENSTSQGTWQDWAGSNGNPYGHSGVKKGQVETSHPFFTYSARWIFEHARSLEEQGVSSYPLLYDSLTERLVGLHMSCATEEQRIGPCWACYFSSKQHLIFEDIDPVYLAFLHGLVSYCKSDLATRVPAPGQTFWDRALSCAIYSNKLGYNETFQEAVSFALQNITSVQQHHIEDSLKVVDLEGPGILGFFKLVLHHDSVKDVRLTDGEGREVGFLWLYAQRDGRAIGGILNLLIEAANCRGEDVRQSCGPEGNLAETLLEQPRTNMNKSKLRLLRSYYDSMSWPFEYDIDEIARER